MKRLITFILLILSLGLTSCSKYDDGYSDGYNDGNDISWGDYGLKMHEASLVAKALSDYWNYPVWAMKLAKDVNGDIWAVFKSDPNDDATIRAFILDDFKFGVTDTPTGWSPTWNSSNYLWGLTYNGNESYSCISGSCKNKYNGDSMWIGMVFEETEGPIKDLEKVAALFENAQILENAEKLKEDFGLSEERSNEVAHLVVNWMKVSNKRSMTNADAKVFSKELLGADIPAWERAVKKSLQGDSEDYEDLIKRAAKVNGITPEHVYGIINTFMD